MTDFTMVIPTYWGGSGDQLIKNEKIVFDHPTPLDKKGTLPSLLDSLDILSEIAKVKIAVITVPNEPGISKAVSDKVGEIIAPYQSRYDIVSLDIFILEKIEKELRKNGVSLEALDLINLENYAAVRNMCSLAGILNGTQCTVFIDDDEVFIDPNFLVKIIEDLEHPVQGETIDALAGYYLQPDTYYLDEKKVPAWRLPYWNNTKAMNQALDRFIGTTPRLKPVPFVFGGNMILTLSTLMKVPFDPRITRGEDIDFLLNLRVNGITFFLDRELSVKHLPPVTKRPAWKGVREDAMRFMYERKKVIDHLELSLEDLKPYPGIFLGPDLVERIIKTNELLMDEYESGGDDDGVTECRANIAMAENDPFKNVDTREWLKKLTAWWREVTSCAKNMGIPG